MKTGNEAPNVQVVDSDRKLINFNDTPDGTLIGQASGGDFTTAYLAGTTITLGSAPYTHTYISTDIVEVQQFDTDGNLVEVFTHASNLMTVTTSVLTITGATFAVSDTFVVYTNINKVEISSGASAIEGTVKIDSSLLSGFLIGKSGGGDFTTTYASGTTITIGTLPYTHTLLADDILAVVQVSTAGVVLNTYTRNDVTLTVAALVLTVTGAAFNSDDTFIIYTNISRELYAGNSISDASYRRVNETSPARANIIREKAFNAQASDAPATGIDISQHSDLAFIAELSGLTGIIKAYDSIDGTTQGAELEFVLNGSKVTEINKTTTTAKYHCVFVNSAPHYIIFDLSSRTAGSVTLYMLGKGI